MKSDLEILARSLEDNHNADSRTLNAANALAEKLQSLRESNPLFEKISFSPAVEQMLESQALAVG